MIQQITKGIKISVKTEYNGISFKNYNNSLSLYHIFVYFITIENRSTETVQLTDRFWEIFDSLKQVEVIKGKGVVGQTPILLPNDNYTYSSRCFLESSIGSMKGFYTMKNLETKESFKAYIPTIQLLIPFLSN